MDIKDLFEEYIIYIQMRGYSDETITAYRGDFRVFLDYLDLKGFDPNLGDIDNRVCRQYTVYLKSKGFGSSTIARKIHSLSSFFKYCIDEDYIEASPLRKVKSPKRQKRIPAYLTPTEVAQLLSTPMKIRDKTAIYLFLHTGIRRQELINLNIQDVDLDNKIIIVRSGKGKKDRQIPISEHLAKILVEYLQWRKDLDEEALIISQYKQRISKPCVHQMFYRVLKRSGIKKKGLSVHKLRHTFATQLLSNGVDLITIQTLLGHENLSTTQIYVNLTGQDLRETHSKASPLNKLAPNLKSRVRKIDK